MLCYFAEPIDQSMGYETALSDRIVKHIVASGATVYRPADMFTLEPPLLTTEVAKPIESINRHALEQADVMVARLPGGAASHGVPMEIEHAARVLGIPVIVVGFAGIALLATPNVHIADTPESFSAIWALVARVKGEVVKPLRHEGYLKPRSYQTDAGIDLTTSELTTVPAGGYGLVPTGVKIELPPGTFGWVVARSSTFRDFRLMVLPGVIDEGYAGEYMASVWNTSDEPVTINPGDRLCQVVVLPNLMAGLTPIPVDRIDAGDRGTNGFGSTS